MDLKKTIRQYWDKRSKDYDCSPGHTDLPDVWKSVLSKIFTKKGRILDIGTGTGFLAILLAELGHEVVGVDISKGMLEKAKSKAKHLDISFKLGDAENLPFSDNSFDATICRHVLWTLPNPERALQEWYRVVKPGGKVVIIDGAWHNETAFSKVKSFVGKLGIAITERRNPWKLNYAKKLPLRRLPPESYVKLLEDVGFSRVSMHDLGWLRRLMLERRPFFYKLAWSSRSYFVLEAYKEV